MKIHKLEVSLLLLLLASPAMAGTNCHTNGNNTYCDDGTTYHVYSNGGGSKYIDTNKGDAWVVPKEGNVSGVGKNNSGEWYNPRSGSWGNAKSGSGTAVIPGLVDK